MKCPRCSSEAKVKNRKIKGKQRYKCKECDYQFTKEHRHEISLAIRTAAVTLCGTLWYVVSSNRRLSKRSHTSVMKWFRDFVEKTYERPSVSEPVVIELDEMWHEMLHLKFTPQIGDKIE